MREIKKLIIHCAATPDDDASNINSNHIRDWHVNGNGWDDIGYHFVITRSGSIERGRPTTKPGAHCRGHNHDSIGICLVGTRRFNDAQYTALIKLCYELMNIYSIPYSQVFGHHEFDSRKECPGFQVGLLRASLARMSWEGMNAGNPSSAYKLP